MTETEKNILHIILFLGLVFAAFCIGACLGSSAVWEQALSRGYAEWTIKDGRSGYYWVDSGGK